MFADSDIDIKSQILWFVLSVCPAFLLDDGVVGRDKEDSCLGSYLQKILFIRTFCCC